MRKQLGGLYARDRRLFEGELFDAGEKRLVAYAEALGGARFVEVAFSERRVNLAALYETLGATAHLRKRASEIEAVQQGGLFSRRIV